VAGKSYTIFGHKGKQVRDQIHNSDVMQALDLFITSPKKGAVYNLGGGAMNSASVLESIQLLEEVSGKTLDYQVMDEARIGDHICYYSDMTKFQNDFPTFRLKYTLEDIALDLIRHEINAQ
jgi:CDP-paratose 2-epimerase